MCLQEPSEGPVVGGEDMEMVFGTGVQILQWGDSELPAQGSVAMEPRTALCGGADALRGAWQCGRGEPGQLSSSRQRPHL